MKVRIKGRVEGMTPHECYEGVFRWHRLEGPDKIKNQEHRERGMTDYQYAYLNFLLDIPSPNAASAEDMRVVFEEVLWGLMEWAYHEKDEHDIEIYRYARRGQEGVAGANRRKSKLCDKFADRRWKEYRVS